MKKSKVDMKTMTIEDIERLDKWCKESKIEPFMVTGKGFYIIGPTGIVGKNSTDEDIKKAGIDL